MSAVLILSVITNLSSVRFSLIALISVKTFILSFLVARFIFSFRFEVSGSVSSALAFFNIFILESTNLKMSIDKKCSYFLH